MIPTWIAGNHEVWRNYRKPLYRRAAAGREETAGASNTALGIDVIMVDQRAITKADGASFIKLGSANIHVGMLVGSKQSVPEEVDHREIGVRMQMMDEVKLLVAPKPSEA